ncbi:hypothetical protein M3Y99_00654500 [Aphelenchoides fujianensis]|nr:hypothetical protein M3Y99_00654500 [Aphelenchoides fujianensis]
MAEAKKGIGFGIDRGGTFTDVFVVYPDNRTRTFKLLSEDTNNYRDAPTEAIRRILNEHTGKEVKRGEKIPTGDISFIRMGTTVATNALLERKGEKTALLITAGFKDLLYIGNQQRPAIFDLDIRIPDVLYEEVHEVEERVLLEDETCEMNIAGDRHKTESGKTVIVEIPLKLGIVREQLERLAEKGIKSLAVLFLHSYIFPQHEEKVAELAADLGFTNISLSSHVVPMIKAVPRGFTASADAYLTPIIQRYIHGFQQGFEGELKDVRLEFMQSDGGLCPVANFMGSKAILSGPAGGVVGVASTGYDPEDKQPCIGFDMGGTSTDVSRYAGSFEHTIETITAGVTIQAPQLEIKTVAAGGGSRLFFDNGLFVVGPESAGSTPGPVCYRKGGHLTVTDANLVLGRIIPDFFPKIFGPSENEPLDKEGTQKAFEELRTDINSQGKGELSVEEIALGFIDVANETMCRPIRTLTEAKGYNTADHVLVCFGGAGGQHACAIARTLGMKKVKIHRYSGILSAYGLVLANAVVEEQEAFMNRLDEEHFEHLVDRFTSLEKKCEEKLKKQDFSGDQIEHERILHLRYDRTDCVLIVSRPSGEGGAQLKQYAEEFERAYKKEFGFIIPDRPVVIDDIRIRSVGNGQSKLKFGHQIEGPALIIDKNATVVVEPRASCHVDAFGNLELEIGDAKSKDEEDLESVDPIRLSIFSHRFMSIAEQMGSVLRRAAISTNIKERLDFSCALFSADGGLIANAPHIPVHLGGMEATVKFQLKSLGEAGIKRGDVLLCNHPKAGGSHLPDLTVITPVFYGDSKTPDFFVANRGHHSDIGGLTAGSMPPHSTSLDQEGATFVSFKIVDEGKFQEAELIAAFKAPGQFPGCSGTRNLRDNLADLNAQIAANQKGIALLEELIEEYSLPVVRAYMGHIQSNAEAAVGKETEKKHGTSVLKATDFMDDGTKICLQVHIDTEKASGLLCVTDTQSFLQGDAVFDFEGTGLQVHSSCNTPPAVRMAAVIYCLRCLIKVPDGTIISPSEKAAVVGGNVLTSQRLCDVIFRAFDACAASQGCMNNITFGDEQFGYYETVAGGAGAGPGFHGRSGVHTHMTNTRITDPEILESRYPVILRRFHLRSDSGGAGKWRGGEGVSRHLQFRRPIELSILTERRVFNPYGLEGGEPGARGVNVLNRAKDGVRVNLGSKNSSKIEAGDTFELETPGGGGFGDPNESEKEESSTQSEREE